MRREFTRFARANPILAPVPNKGCLDVGLCLGVGDAEFMIPPRLRQIFEGLNIEAAIVNNQLLQGMGSFNAVNPPAFQPVNALYARIT
jgi:hypothetical protein